MQHIYYLSVWSQRFILRLANCADVSNYAGFGVLLLFFLRNTFCQSASL